LKLRIALASGQVIDRLRDLGDQSRDRDQSSPHQHDPAHGEHDGDRHAPIEPTSLEPADRRVERSHQDQRHDDDHQDRQQQAQQPDCTHRQRDGHDGPEGDLDAVNDRAALAWWLGLRHEAANLRRTLRLATGDQVVLMSPPSIT
jgi:hypothetical protein